MIYNASKRATQTDSWEVVRLQTPLIGSPAPELNLMVSAKSLLKGVQYKSISICQINLLVQWVGYYKHLQAENTAVLGQCSLWA